MAKCTSPINGYMKPGGGFTTKRTEGYGDVPVQVACGQCMDCRINRSLEWSIRIIHEAKMHDINSFLTLTYDDDNLPENLSLDKSHIRNFMKRLRKKIYPQKIRYYLCGEYGDKTLRPHYHVIVFGYWPKDTKHYKNTVNQDRLFKSKELDKIWKKGFVTVGSVSPDSASYTAGYVTKKITGNKADSHYNGREPEFATMSNRPGIGRQYYEKYKEEIWNSKSIIWKGKETAVPRYYYQRLKSDSPDHYDEVLKERLDKIKKKLWLNPMWKSLDEQERDFAFREKYTRLTHKQFKKSNI